MVYQAVIKFKADQSPRTRNFDTREEAEIWIQESKDQNTYGQPEDFTTEVRDVTQETEDAADEKEGETRRAIGGKVLDRLFGVNKRKGLSSAQLVTLASNPQLALAERFLHNGALDTARNIIMAVGPDAGYTPEEIARIVAPIPASTAG